MPGLVDVKVRGLADVLVKLEGMRQRTRDLSPALRDFGDRLRGANAARFAAGGPGWSPLSPRYAAYKLKHFGAQPLLVAEGGLLDDLTSKPMDIEVVGPQRGTWGTRRPYARYHQRGTKNMPKREVLVVGEALQKELNRLIADHVVGSLD